ncbi:Sorting and assembly machinery component 50 -like protein B [Halotydeus destructor]|nr:Sorting and assembly machinery component 50 -like protein B [Halotydeus destructor]
MANLTEDAPRQPEKAQSNQIPLTELKARVDKVCFEGIGRTRDDVLVNISKELFDSSNFDDLIVNVHNVKEKLGRLGAFKGIGVLIDTAKGPDATVNGYEITYHLTEQNRVAGGIHTYIGNNNSGSLVTQLRFPNAVGRGERVNLEYQKGNKHTSGFNVTLTKPLIPWIESNPTLTLQAFKQGYDAPWSGFREVDQGLLAGLATKLGSDVEHIIRWEGIWRELSCLPDASFKVREESGHSLKSCIKNILQKDWRDHPVLPTTGGLVRLEQEFAGIGGNIGFHKHEMELQYNVPLQDIVIQGCFRTGVLRLSSKGGKVASITDRFFIGGPLSLRGFKLFGVGPHAENCATGANTFWVGGLHIYTPLPFRPGQGGLGDIFRTHFFLNAGTIGNIDAVLDQYKTLSTLTNRLRYSAGLGIVVALGAARFELNYTYPWGQLAGDRVDTPLQFGLGVSFV